MIELLRTLSQALCEAHVTAANIAERIGRAQPRTGSLAPLLVEPKDSSITQAEIVGDSDSAPPAYIRLTLTASTLTLDAMRAAFGEGSSVPRSRPGQGARWLFHVRPQGRRYECALIVETTAAGSDVQTVTLRRDQRV